MPLALTNLMIIKILDLIDMESNFTCGDRTGVQPSASKTGPVWATGDEQALYNIVECISMN